MKINRSNNIRKNKYRVRRSIYPTNRIILAEHGVRQVLFPYDLFMPIELIKFSVWSFGSLRYLPTGFLIKTASRILELKLSALAGLGIAEGDYAGKAGGVSPVQDKEVLEEVLHAK